MAADGLMSSFALLDLVNKARAEFDESEVRRNDFTARCRDELDGEYYETFVVKNSRGPASEELRLTKDQCMFIAMRESKSVRRRVVALLNEKAAPISLPTHAEALRLYADQLERNLELECERDQAVETKAEIGARREATAMNTASQAVKKARALEVQLDHSKEYCTIKRMEMLKHGQKFEWRRLKSTCTEMGIQAVDVFDQNYGTVKAYHVDVWREAYGIGLDD